MKKIETGSLIRLSPDQFARLEKFPILFAADRIRSGHNIGSLFRIADAFALEGILLSPYCVHPPHPEIEKTALGATQTVLWTQAEDLVQQLLHFKKSGYRLLGLEHTDRSIPLQSFKIDRTSRYILVLGHEIDGVSPEVLAILDDSIEIPQFGTKHSLNVSVAAGIAAWHFAKEWI